MIDSGSASSSDAARMEMPHAAYMTLQQLPGGGQRLLHVPLRNYLDLPADKVPFQLSYVSSCHTCRARVG